METWFSLGNDKELNKDYGRLKNGYYIYKDRKNILEVLSFIGFDRETSWLGD